MAFLGGQHLPGGGGGVFGDGHRFLWNVWREVVRGARRTCGQVRRAVRESRTARTAQTARTPFGAAAARDGRFSGGGRGCASP
ncbi:hypothetical protein Snoj_23480 [Streptomyces nojiriensis]|uniref:Uncharacterized protein n=1 Tax=Streptomyces nojiriensis TaxID=66374 RepID=A0ABQ3SKP9_9ACTN|nr:hypothetical protein GCM10010205_60250 [Streptomyces nojiriensis]GHI68430.1 hypothetical protein Snoj_23480 [Streptomyces nojiriensis]